MSKRRKRLDKLPGQKNLFEYIRQQSQTIQRQPTEGTMNISEPLRRALNQALKECPRSRHQVAGEMSHLLGIEITQTTIDSWTAESKPGNRIPGEYIPAFCKATGSRLAISVITDASGIFALPGRDALRSEIQKFKETVKEANSEIRKREIFLKEMEGRSK